MEEKGGEIFVLLLYFGITNMCRTVSPPGEEEWIQVRYEPEDEVVDVVFKPPPVSSSISSASNINLTVLQPTPPENREVPECARGRWLIDISKIKFYHPVRKPADTPPCPTASFRRAWKKKAGKLS